VAVVWRQALVHHEERNRRKCKHDPKAVNEIEAIDPESYDDTKNGRVVKREQESPEAHVREISLVFQQLEQEVKAVADDESGEN